MAGDDQGEWVFGECAADGSGGGGLAELLCQPSISDCLAELHLPAGGQDRGLEGGQSGQVDGDIGAEVHRGASEISRYPLLHLFEEGPVKFTGGHPLQKSCLDFLGFRTRQVRSAKRMLGAGKAEITPFRPENRVFYRLLHFFAQIVCSTLSNAPKFIDARGKFC